MSAPQQAREELAVRFMEAMLRQAGTDVIPVTGPIEGERFALAATRFVSFAFALSEAVIARRSPGSCYR